EPAPGATAGPPLSAPLADPLRRGAGRPVGRGPDRPACAVRPGGRGDRRAAPGGPASSVEGSADVHRSGAVPRAAPTRSVDDRPVRGDRGRPPARPGGEDRAGPLLARRVSSIACAVLGSARHWSGDPGRARRGGGGHSDRTPAPTARRPA